MLTENEKFMVERWVRKYPTGHGESCFSDMYLSEYDQASMRIMCDVTAFAFA